MPWWSQKSTREKHLKRLDVLAQRPEAWEGLAAVALRELTSRQIAVYGRHLTPSNLPQLQRLYRLVIDRSEAAQRHEMLQATTRDIARGEIGWWALMPYLQLDPDLGVIVAATGCAVRWIPPQDGDELTGARTTIAMMRSLPHDSLSRVGGLLVMGDPRVISMVEGAWRGLAPSVRLRLMEALPLPAPPG
ncbi:MAG: hypothetical protein ACI8S6_004298 [Myxococcota bacterium]|jgi:hypothetical protein